MRTMIAIMLGGVICAGAVVLLYFLYLLSLWLLFGRRNRM